MANCYDCGLPYNDLGFADLLVPTDVWKIISPTGNEGGLLCPTCLVRAAEKAGVENVRVAFMSGPFWEPDQDHIGKEIVNSPYRSLPTMDANPLPPTLDYNTVHTCWTAINNHIKPGPLQGNGCDETAQRNGLILASNIINDLMKQSEKYAQPVAHSKSQERRFAHQVPGYEPPTKDTDNG